MIRCQNCGNSNSTESNFCRFCGAQFNMSPQQQYPPAQEGFDAAPPRPYVWKTDEFQTQSEPRKARHAERIQPLAGPHSQFGSPDRSLAYRAPSHLGVGYHCPRCGATTLPVIERRVSTAGWITFSLLLVFTIVFFWIGLLMKENVSVCPVCRARVS